MKSSNMRSVINISIINIIVITFCASRRRRKMYCGHARLCTIGRIWARVALLWQHNVNLSYKLASIPRYDDIVRTAGWAGSVRAAGRWLAGDGGHSQNCAPYMGSGRGWLTGDWPSTGGILNITAVVWTAGFHWWHSGNKKRTQNISEYILVLTPMPS